MTQDWSFCLFTHSHDVHCPARNDLFMPRFLIVDENNYYPSLRPGQSLSIQRLTSPSLSTHCLLISSLSTLSSAASSPLSEWSWPRLRAGVEQCWAGSHNPYYLQPFKDLFILCYLKPEQLFLCPDLMSDWVSQCHDRAVSDCRVVMFMWGKQLFM